MGIGSRLRTARRSLGLTLTQLAKLSKVSKAYLSQLENERFSNPSSEVLVKLCGVLGITAEALLGLEPVPTIITNRISVPVLLRALAKEEHLDDKDVAVLSNISYQGRQPASIDGWRTVLKAIRQSVEDTK